MLFGHGCIILISKSCLSRWLCWLAGAGEALNVVSYDSLLACNCQLIDVNLVEQLGIGRMHETNDGNLTSRGKKLATPIFYLLKPSFYSTAFEDFHQKVQQLYPDVMLNWFQPLTTAHSTENIALLKSNSLHSQGVTLCTGSLTASSTYK